MILLEIPTDAILLARIAGLMLFFLFTRKRLTNSLKKKYGNLDIMDEMISLESIFTLASYLVLLGLFSYLWPPGWKAWHESPVFWPAQGLIILAVIGLFSLRKKFTSWFFFSFFMIIALTLTAVSIIRDPNIFPPRIARDEPQPVFPEPIPEPVNTSSVVVVEIPEKAPIDSAPYQSKVENQPTAKQKPDSVFKYLEAPWGRDGENIWLDPSYRYLFYPDDTVEGFPDMGKSFIDYPGNTLTLKYFQNIHWNSHCGHDTKVTVVRKWKSNGWH